MIQKSGFRIGGRIVFGYSKELTSNLWRLVNSIIPFVLILSLFTSGLGGGQFKDGGLTHIESKSVEVPPLLGDSFNVKTYSYEKFSYSLLVYYFLPGFREFSFRHFWCMLA